MILDVNAGSSRGVLKLDNSATLITLCLYYLRRQSLQEELKLTLAKSRGKLAVSLGLRPIRVIDRATGKLVWTELRVVGPLNRGTAGTKAFAPVVKERIASDTFIVPVSK